QAVTRNTLKGRKQLGEYQIGWKIKTGNILDFCNQMSTQQYTKSGVAKHLGVAGLQQKNGLVKETNVTLLAKRLKTPIDMLEFFVWLASIKQGMLEPVKVKCIFLGYRKGIVGNKLWRCCVDLSLRWNSFEVEPQENADQGAGLQEVQTQDLMDYQLARDREQHLACELFGYREDSNEAAFAVAAVEKIYAHESLTFNDTVACEVISKWKTGLKDDMDARSDAEILATKGLLVKAKGNVLGMKIIRDQSGNTPDVGMLDKFDRGLQTEVQVFVDFDYVMAGYMTLTEAANEAIWLKGLSIESGFQLKIVAGIATGALSKAIPGPRFQHRLKLLRIKDF
ncbi:hypothetical protein Tco_1355649, partial [Tanacetum coccineum]